MTTQPAEEITACAVCHQIGHATDHIAEIREHAVARPGDTLVVTLDDMASPEYLDLFAAKLREAFGPDVKVTVMANVKQIAIMRPTGEETP